MKQTVMLVVSLRGVNFGFWSRLGCSKKIIKNIRLLCLYIIKTHCMSYLVSLRGQNLLKPHPDWSHLGVPKT